MKARQNAESPAAAQPPPETTPSMSVASPPLNGPAPATPAEQDQEQEQENGKGNTAQNPESAVANVPVRLKQDQGQDKQALVLSPVLGRVEVLTESEQAELWACKEVIGSGSHGVLQMGLALARIRDGRLYKVEFDTFEAYCRVKWQYGRRYVDRLISAAQVFTNLGTISSRQKPEHETQVRPLIGLTAEQAQLTWQHAVEKAGGRKITAAMVKAAVKELQPAGNAQPVTGPPRQNKAEQRRLIDGAIGELLVLLSQKASHEILTEKVEALHRYIHSLFPKPSSKT